MFFDGGLRYLRLDLKSGALIGEEIMDDSHPFAGGKMMDKDNIRWPDMPVALPDILSSDGEYVYMRRQPFDLEGKRLNERREHLYSPTGFLGSSDWWHRTYWIFAPEFGYATGYKAPARKYPAARIMSIDENQVYGFGAKPPHMYNGWSMSWWSYQLFAMEKNPEMDKAPPADSTHFLRRGISGLKQWPEYLWNRDLPCLVRSMVLCGDILFIAGPPSLLDEGKAIRDPDDPAIQKAALEQENAMNGAHGGILLAINSKTGETLNKYKIDFVPEWDSMIASNERLYVTTLDGGVVCLGSKNEKN
jgi:hypothetical protein